MSLHISCPDCSTTAKLPDEMRDRTMRCPQCQAVFAVRDAMDDSEAETRDDEDERPRRRPLVIAGVMGGALGLIAAGVAAVLLVRGGDLTPNGRKVIRLENLYEQFFPHNMANLPPLPPAKRVEPGIVVHKMSWSVAPPKELFPPVDPFAPYPQQDDFVTRRVWIYLPEKAAGRLPVVLIAPAGSPLVIGMDLSKKDRPEHLPYVRAGFAVVAYSLDGSVPNFEHLPLDRWGRGMNAFIHANGGIENARMALDYALARVPALDPERIYTAGHSSAGTLSLLVAEHEPRIKGCIAYAPVTNMSRQPGGIRFVWQLQNQCFMPVDFFVNHLSPLLGADSLHCPVFLFHADDDPVVSTIQAEEFVNRLRDTNSKVKYVCARGGGHYNSMIRQGIPQAIAWLKKQTGR